MFVKICGLSTADTVATAVHSGADAVGFVLTPSPRQLTPAQARKLSAAVPAHVLTVAVAAGIDIATASDMARRANVNALQLHGDYSKADFRTAANLGLKLIRATNANAPHLRPGAYGEQLLIVDASTPGSGNSWDYSLLDTTTLGSNWILAGGLTPHNVATAISLTGANGVDVSSGVETSRGIKNNDMIKTFIEAAKGT